MLALACLGLIFMDLYTQMGVGNQELSIEVDSQKVG